MSHKSTSELKVSVQAYSTIIGEEGGISLKITPRGSENKSCWGKYIQLKLTDYFFPQ